MVQLNLPKNSEVKKGKYFKDKTGSKNLRRVNVYRWDPSTEENPRIEMKFNIFHHKSGYTNGTIEFTKKF